MGFILKGTEEFSLNEIKAQFAPFTCGADALPHCEITFSKRPKDLLKNRERFKKAGDHSFYILEEGILVANATSFALMRKDFKTMEVYLPDNVFVPQRQTAFLMLQAYRYALCHHGHFQMHAAVVSKDGEAVAFCGLPGAGKSTQAHLWEEYLGAEALNLDQPCILFEPDGVLASGSPWSGKEDCYKTDALPLKAVFFVEQAKENSVERLRMAESFSYLFLNNFLIPTSEDIEIKQKQAVEKLVNKVPVYRLKCDISKEAVMTAYNEVFKK